MNISLTISPNRSHRSLSLNFDHWWKFECLRNVLSPEYFFLDQQKGEECPKVSHGQTPRDLSQGEENKGTKWEHQGTT